LDLDLNLDYRYRRLIKTIIICLIHGLPVIDGGGWIESWNNCYGFGIQFIGLPSLIKICRNLMQFELVLHRRYNENKTPDTLIKSIVTISRQPWGTPLQSVRAVYWSIFLFNRITIVSSKHHENCITLRHTMNIDHLQLNSERKISR
jgi:hypothetical protein